MPEKKVDSHLEGIIEKVREIPNVVSVQKSSAKKGIIYCKKCDTHTNTIEKGLHIEYIKEYNFLGFPTHEILSSNHFKICKSCGNVQEEPINYNTFIPSTKNAEYKGRTKLSIY